MGASLMLPGSCPAGCPCPASGEAAGDYQEAHSPCVELIPCFGVRKRDRAHREIKNIFFKVIQKRRQSGENTDDILQTLVDATYK